MRKIIALAVCFVLISAVAAQADELKIAVFNLQKVASECDALQDAKKVLEKSFGAQKTEIEKQRRVIDAKAESLKNKSTEAQQAELRKMQREFSEKANAYVRAVQTAEDRIRKDIDTVVIEAAKELAKKKGFNLILDASTAAIYHDPSMDVTNDMLVEANTWWKNNTGKK